MVFLWGRSFLSLKMCGAHFHPTSLRKAGMKEKALEYLNEQSDKHFDPKLVSVFL